MKHRNGNETDDDGCGGCRGVWRVGLGGNDRRLNVDVPH